MSILSNLGAKLGIVRAAQASPYQVGFQQPPSLADSAVIPQAKDRTFDRIERRMGPEEMHGILEGVLDGNLVMQKRLYASMIDTSPKIQGNLAQVAQQVASQEWEIRPYCKRGEKPTPEAEARAKEVEGFLWNSRPDPVRNEKGFEGLLKILSHSYFSSPDVVETRWEQTADGWHPRAYKALSARYYGYVNFEVTPDDLEDRLMFRPEGEFSNLWVDFKDVNEGNRFLVAINTPYEGHPVIASPMRALSDYWLAATFGLKWFMQYANLFGVPFRKAKYVGNDIRVRQRLEEMMRRVGSAGYVVLEDGADLTVENNPTSGQSLPQRELIALTDEKADQFILGQTLTTSAPEKGGSRAQGDVHADTLNSIIKGVCDYVGGIISEQLIKAICRVNYGDDSECPTFGVINKDTEDGTTKAEFLKAVISDVGLEVGKAYAYEYLGVPVPAPGEEVVEKSQPAQIDPETGMPIPPQNLPPGGKGKAVPTQKGDNPPNPDAPKPEDKQQVAASAVSLFELIQQLPKADPAAIEQAMEDAAKGGE